jgi:hypothetical protein
MQSGACRCWTCHVCSGPSQEKAQTFNSRLRLPTLLITLFQHYTQLAASRVQDAVEAACTAEHPSSTRIRYWIQLAAVQRQLQHQHLLWVMQDFEGVGIALLATWGSEPQHSLRGRTEHEVLASQLHCHCICVWVWCGRACSTASCYGVNFSHP